MQFLNFIRREEVVENDNLFTSDRVSSRARFLHGQSMVRILFLFPGKARTRIESTVDDVPRLRSL
jgi:hypothetical protein